MLERVTSPRVGPHDGQFLYEVVGACVVDCVCPAGRSGLFEDAIDVGLDGVAAEEEGGGDGRVAHAAGDHGEDLRLAPCEPVREVIRRRVRRVGFGAMSAYGGDQRGLNAGVEDREAGCCAVGGGGGVGG